VNIQVGLVGAGIVGGGVLEVFERQKAFFSSVLGLDIKLSMIAEKDSSKLIGLPLEGIQVTDNFQDILQNPNIQIVIELIGGITVAKEVVLRSIAAGKHVVTANKHLLAKFGYELFPAAEKKGVGVYFEGSVGGGIPIIKTLREGLVGNDIKKIHCIINGTTNYILTRIQNEHRPFLEILREAQKKGFAEADPSLDVDGIDAAHKVSIMASLAYGCWVKLDDVYTEGIRNITPVDVQNAEELGYVIKLLGIIQVQGEKLDVRVHPTMLRKDHLLTHVNGVFNGVLLKGDAAGSILVTGKGAGRHPTASAVIADMVDASRDIAMAGGKPRISMHFLNSQNQKKVVPIQEIESRYYLRFTVVDFPGVLARLTAELGQNEVSIASVMQKERAPADNVPVVILTHHAKEAQIRKAVEAIDRFDVVKLPTQVIRIEEEKEE
jgi:homoserine dehydrogenase